MKMIDFISLYKCKCQLVDRENFEYDPNLRSILENTTLLAFTEYHGDKASQIMFTRFTLSSIS